jgi:hypothetical protein
MNKFNKNDIIISPDKDIGTITDISLSGNYFLRWNINNDSRVQSKQFIEIHFKKTNSKLARILYG